MRFTPKLFLIGVVVVAAGRASADNSEGITGSDWDDSHMRTRHLPAVSAAPRAASIATGAVEPDGTRTLPTSEYRSWESGPITPSSVRRAPKRSKSSVAGHSASETAKSRGRRSSSRASSRSTSTRSRKTTR